MKQKEVNTRGGRFTGTRLHAIADFKKIADCVCGFLKNCELRNLLHWDLLCIFEDLGTKYFYLHSLYSEIEELIGFLVNATETAQIITRVLLKHSCLSLGFLKNFFKFQRGGKEPAIS